ncbi:MAG: DedA family protein [Nitrososphaeria archaeon]|nr:DedA family protein [Nitrososphaeria archaeon]
MIQLTDLIDFLIHLDQGLAYIIQEFGIWTYIILFLIIFCETGLVMFPFLPGDSLLFLSGTFASKRLFIIEILYFIYITAAVLGDTVNYWIGHFIGPKVFTKEKSRFFNKRHLSRAHDFYEKHGGKTIVLARFIPIIRTFAPFVAGIGKMSYKKFIIYNIMGGILWVTIFLFGGYLFGNLQFVKDNLTSIIYMIIIISLLPALIEALKQKSRK